MSSSETYVAAEAMVFPPPCPNVRAPSRCLCFCNHNSLRQKRYHGLPVWPVFGMLPCLWHYSKPTHMSCSTKFFAAKMERLDSKAHGLAASLASSLATLVTWSTFSRPSSPISSKALISKTPSRSSGMAYSDQTAINGSAKEGSEL
ncbi:hypothetical protein ACFXTI_039909 [Malus domestica]